MAITPGGEQVQSLRLWELAERHDFQLLLRSPSSLVLRERRTRLLGPQLTLIANSALPHGQNDGALWAGRGANLRAVGGGVVFAGPLAITLLPELVWSGNSDFTYRQPATPLQQITRSEWANPWNTAPYSIDAPLRFGDGAVARLHPGQSSIVVGRAFQVGLATENHWWGPGIRNAIVLSDNAPGFPHVFLRTGRPFRTRIGAFDARWLIGGVRESRFFDFDGTNDVRSLSAAAATWSPDTAHGVTLGVARAVITPVRRWSATAGHAFKVFTAIGTPEIRQEQITSLFARLAPPGSGFEAYGEWARNRSPRSLNDLWERPNDSQGYTVGLQWRSAVAEGAPFLAVQAEHTFLELGPAAVVREQNSYYTNRFGGHGWTNEGQVLGAGIGQGSSGQWLAVDHHRQTMRVGVFLGRTRWNNDAFIAAFPTLDPQPLNRACFHDVTMYGGARAGWRGILALDYTLGRRLNPFFQWEGNCPDRDSTVDVTNHTISLTFTPRW